MLSQHIMHRIVLSLFLLAIAFTLSCTNPATEAYTTPTIVKPTPPIPKKETATSNLSQALKTRVVAAHTPLFEQKSSASCLNCDLSYTNPSLTLTLMAIIADILVMASLICGASYLAHWTALKSS